MQTQPRQNYIYQNFKGLLTSSFVYSISDYVIHNFFKICEHICNLGLIAILWNCKSPFWFQLSYALSLYLSALLLFDKRLKFMCEAQRRSMLLYQLQIIALFLKKLRSHCIACGHRFRSAILWSHNFDLV